MFEPSRNSTPVEGSRLQSSNRPTTPRRSFDPSQQAPDGSPSLNPPTTRTQPVEPWLIRKVTNAWLTKHWKALLWPSLYFLALMDGLNLGAIFILAGPVSEQFNSFQLYSWIVSADLIAQAVCKPLIGRLIKTFSHQSLMILSNLFFIAGLAVDGAATSGWMFIGGQVLIGVGVAGHGNLTQDLIKDHIMPKIQPFRRAIYYSVLALGTALGGLYGGTVADAISWRLTFFIQIPFISVLAIVCLLFVPAPKELTTLQELSFGRKMLKIDWIGAVSLSTALITLSYGLIAGGNLFPWSHPEVWPVLVASGLLFAIFFTWEWFSESMLKLDAPPIINAKLLVSRSFSLFHPHTMFFLLTDSIFSLYIPIYLQVMGLSSGQYGLWLLIPTSCGIAGSLVASILAYFVLKNEGQEESSLSGGALKEARDKRRRHLVYVNLFFLSFIIASAASIAILFDLQRGFLLFVLLDMGIWFGNAGVEGTNGTLLFEIVTDQQEQTIALSAWSGVRSISRALGVAVGGIMFQNIVQKQLGHRFSGQDDQAEIRKISGNLDELKHLPAGWEDGVMDSIGYTLRAIFVAGAAFAAAAGLLMLVLLFCFMPRPRKAFGPRNKRSSTAISRIQLRERSS